MVFQANTYSVLLVSASEKNVAATLPLLPPSDFYPVSVAGSVSEAQRRLMGESFDLVIINSPLPDDAGIQFSMDVSSTTDAGVMLMVRSDIYEDTYYSVLPAGVVTLSKPTSIQMVSHNLRVLCSIRERLRSVKKQQNTMEERMKEEIRAAGIRCEAYNVGTMWQDYTPQTLSEIIARQGRGISLI